MFYLYIFWFILLSFPVFLFFSFLIYTFFHFFFLLFSLSSFSVFFFFIYTFFSFILLLFLFSCFFFVIYTFLKFILLLFPVFFFLSFCFFYQYSFSFILLIFPVFFPLFSSFFFLSIHFFIYSFIIPCVDAPLLIDSPFIDSCHHFLLLVTSRDLSKTRIYGDETGGITAGRIRVDRITVISCWIILLLTLDRRRFESVV